MRSRSIAAAAVALLLTFGDPAIDNAPAAQAPSRGAVVRALARLDARDLDGSTWTYERMRGRVVLVDFWATWCAPCLRELPYLKRARARYGDEFEILGISLDTSSRAALGAWLHRHGVRWSQIHAADGFEDRVARSFGIDRLPTNMLIDRAGRVRHLNLRGEALLSAVEELLDERAE